MSEDQQRKDVKSLTIDLYSENRGHQKSPSNLKAPTRVKKIKESNLRDYQNSASKNSSKNVRKIVAPKGHYPTMSKMQDVVQSYIKKTKNRDIRSKNIRQKQDSLDDFENESFPTERPNEEVPVPHQMQSIHRKRRYSCM